MIFSFVAIMFLIAVVLSLIDMTKSFNPSRSMKSNARRCTIQCMSTSTMPVFQEHFDYLKDVAKVNPPRKLELLLQLLEMTDGEEIVSPKVRKGMNPFLIPISRSKVDGSMLCYIRWPTQKETMDLQLVRTTNVGIYLVAMGTDQYCHRLAVEQDFFCLPTSTKALELLNASGQTYSSGEYMPLLKSGKFPALTEADLKLVLDRYLLTKVGAFPDCYERLANNFFETKNEISALVTCERAVSIFYGWGHPVNFHAKLMSRLPGRGKEARDAARASLGQPAWTVGKDQSDLEALALLAGFTGTAILGEMHAFRARDPRTDDIGEGMSPVQVTLDQAAHLMDAVALGNIAGGWEAVKEELAQKYHDGGYPEIAVLIRS